MAGLVNVLPSQTAHNFANRKQRNVKPLRELPLTHTLTIQCLNFLHLRLIQFGLTICRTNMVLAALLLNAITMVVERSPKKQMIRIYAGAVIAFMTYIQRLHKIAKRQFVSETVRGDNNSRLQSETSVTVLVASTSPKPTRVGFADVFCKSNFGRDRQRACFYFFGAAVTPHPLVVG